MSLQRTQRGLTARPRTRPRTRRALVAAALCVPGLLAMAAVGGAAESGADATNAARGPVSSSTHSAAVEFTDLEFSVPF